MEIKKELTWANGMTLLRVLLIFPVVYFIFQKQFLLATALLIVALVTDYFDGYLARRFHQGTLFGKRLDQIADKTLLFSVLFALLLPQGSSFWLFFYLCFLLFFGVGIVFIIKKKLYASLVQRVCMWLQAVTLLVMVLGYVNNFTLSFFAFFLLISAAEYGWRVFYRRNI